MSIEIPKAMSLWSEQGHHAGLMLLASEPGAESGDCVFMLSPSSTEGIDSDLGIVVSELKSAGEHKFQACKTHDGFEIKVLPEDHPEIICKLDCQFSGQVITEFGDKYAAIGSIEPAQKSA